MTFINTLASEFGTRRNKKLTQLRNIIASEALVSKDQRKIFGTKGEELSWIFDIRNISLQPSVLEIIADLFWEQNSDKTEYQIGGLETASIPLITAIVLEGKRRGKNVTGFYIRKSRKKLGLVKQIEGKLTNAPVVLVDDLINTGKSFDRQIELLSSEGLDVRSIFTVVRFRKDDAYQTITDRGIQIRSLFSLPDFSIAYLKDPTQRKITFDLEKYFKSKHASLIYVLPKSPPLVYESCIYWGTDNGHVWCLDKETLAVKWHRQLGLFTKQHIFASLLMVEGKLVCPTYNGALYVLNAEKGNVIYHDILGEKITATPLVMKGGQVLIVSVCEHTSGSIVALDTKNLEKLWEHKTENAVSGTGIVYDSSKFLILDKGGKFYAGDQGGVKKTKNSGVKVTIGNLALETSGTKIYWGSMRGKVYETLIHSLMSRELFEADGGIFGVPYVSNHQLFTASLDKNLYCFDLERKKLDWTFETRGRIFASPIEHEGVVYIGSNDAKLYAVDVHNGEELGYYQATERITTPVVMKGEKELLLTTFANELYKLTIQKEK